MAGEPAHALQFRRRQGAQFHGGVRRTIRPFQREQRHAQGSQQLRMGRNDHLTANQMSKRMPERMVQRHAALQKHLPADATRPLDLCEVVGGDGINQPGDNIVVRMPLLLGGTNIGVDERRAGRFEMHGRVGTQRHAGYFRHRHAEVAPGAFFQKGAGAGGTSVVHRIVNGNAIAEMDVLGILAANFHDRVHLVVEMGRTGGVSGDFVEDIFGAQVRTDDFPRRACGSDQADAAVTHLIGQGPQARAQRGHGVALCAQVVGSHDPPVAGSSKTALVVVDPASTPSTIGPSGGNCRGGAGIIWTWPAT